MPLFQRLSEGVARKTTRRSLFGRGASLAFGTLAGAAAGTLAQAGGAIAGQGTVCVFPGPPCHCSECQVNGVCGKPCVILTAFYTSGCWVEGNITCCDCKCPTQSGSGWCGCGSDYHNDVQFCP
jgi:hypothetical protein